MIWIVLAAALSAAPGVAERQGLAVVRCQVTAAGALRACVVVSETPAGANVGAFALKLVKAYRIQPHDRRVKNGAIVIQMKFKLP